LKEKVAASVQKTENTAEEIRHADHVAPSIRKRLALTSPTSGGRSVGVVRSRTQATEFSLVFLMMVYNTQNRWVHALCSSSGVLENATFRQLIQFPSEEVGYALFGPFERANFNHWTQ
jgi:hypothetical protein